VRGERGSADFGGEGDKSLPQITFAEPGEVVLGVGFDIELPWASIAGFADVAMVMAVVLVVARRHQRRRRHNRVAPSERRAT